MSQGSNAVISLIFAEYLNRLFWHATRNEVSPDEIPQWAIQVTAIVAVSLITFVCVIARNLGTKIAVVFTSVKVRQAFWPGDTYRTASRLDSLFGMHFPARLPE
jgi:hypothetical protein